MDWGRVFFLLHQYCGLNKWEIWEYTLPQISELMKNINKHIEFEVQVSSSGLGLLGSMFGGVDEDNEDDYEEITAEDVQELMGLFGS